MYARVTTKQRIIICLIIPWLGLIAPANVAFALDPLLSLKVGEAEAKLKVIEDALADAAPGIEVRVLNEFQEQGLEVENIADECIEVNESAINQAAEDLDLLGEQMLTENEEVTQKRVDLNQSMLSNAQQLASCRLLLLRAHETTKRAQELGQQALASQLLGKRPSLFINIKENLLNPSGMIDATADFVRTDSGIKSLLTNLPLVVTLLLLALVLIAVGKKLLKTSLRKHQRDEHGGYLNQFQVSLISCANRHLSALVLTGSLSLYYAYQIFAGMQLDFLGLILFGLFLYVLLNFVIRVLLNPYPPAQRLTDLPADIAQLLARRLHLLTKLLLAGYLMYSATQIHEFPQQVTALLRNVYLFLLILNLIWAVWLLRFYQGVSKIDVLRILIVTGLVACLIADWLGYVNLANYILLGVTGSILAWAVTIFVLRLWKDFLDSLDEGRHSWQQLLRRRIGVKDDEYLPGSLWFRFTFALIIWSLFLVALLKVWGLPDTMLLQLREVLTEGFEIGTVLVVPIKVVIALLSFAVMLSLIGWLKRRMEKSWLKRSRMDRGSKEAMVSLSGYFGVAVAFLIGLSIAGVELANVALVAGALSVGIGFGLQNIVNNFVSGVILLFERPVKTGDWIIVGGTEGYVKKISIRSTQIQTFDRSDVIVPNSELISGQVTNWMFRDSIGRVVVPVGVAYGSDVEQVKSILLDVAYQHSAVITQSPILPKPYVLFMAFGDSSLDFQLRCFIREVDDKLSVVSDLNFSIEHAFRDSGIEIPFPQRDVHLITPEDGVPDPSSPNK